MVPKPLPHPPPYPQVPPSPSGPEFAQATDTEFIHKQRALNILSDPQYRQVGQPGRRIGGLQVFIANLIRGTYTRDSAKTQLHSQLYVSSEASFY